MSDEEEEGGGVDAFSSTDREVASAMAAAAADAQGLAAFLDLGENGRSEPKDLLHGPSPQKAQPRERARRICEAREARRRAGREFGAAYGERCYLEEEGQCSVRISNARRESCGSTCIGRRLTLGLTPSSVRDCDIRTCAGDINIAKGKCYYAYRVILQGVITFIVSLAVLLDSRKGTNGDDPISVVRLVLDICVLVVSLVVMVLTTMEGAYNYAEIGHAERSMWDRATAPSSVRKRFLDARRKGYTKA